MMIYGNDIDNDNMSMTLTTACDIHIVIYIMEDKIY